MSTIRNTHFLLLFALLLYFPATTHGQIIVGHTIAGKVLSKGGQPMANLLVELQTGNGQPINQTTKAIMPFADSPVVRLFWWSTSLIISLFPNASRWRERRKTARVKPSV